MDVMIVMIVLGRLIHLRITGNDRPPFFGDTWKSRLWATMVLLWDIIDYWLFAWWYMDARPGRNQAAEFEEDFVVAKLCCWVLWVGPCLPLLAVVLSRKQYTGIQFLYDSLELFLVWYTDYRYDFKTVGQMATVANYWSTIVDAVVFKSPALWYRFWCEPGGKDDFDGGNLLDTESPPE